ncbi:protein phosphatase [Trypanosoma theileri]|uniref:Serine/threonine-protein phosphatase n=1 Tax=Trypanosoma theileri TaxID=67003 RepID=A0A1X0NIN2_9TRYP|nr:protein phosphatase [Trypanosoma theileri]ORC84602.1 protein phosphatase [Trypanosoma theileri]
MWDKHCIVVEEGRELIVGTDPLCDVQVTLPKLRVFGSHLVVSRYHDIAHVICSTNGVLLLSISTRSLSVYIHGIQVVPSREPIELYPGSPVSFGGRHKGTTFCFFTSHTSPAVISPMPSAKFSPLALNLNGMKKSLPFPPLNATCNVTEQGVSPRSPRVVRIIGPSDNDNDNDNDDNDNNGNSNKYMSTCHTSVSLLSSFKNSSKSISNYGKSITTYDTQWKFNTENKLPSSHTIVPFVVELWGLRATLHSVIGHNTQSRSASTRSCGVAEISGRGGNTPGDPYFTFRGCEMLKGLHLSRIETPVRSAAASVLESLEDAYEPGEGTFLQFTTSAKNSLFQHFLLLADHALIELQKTPLTVRRCSPIVCCGDIHGSFSDLKTIFDNVVPFHHWSLMTMPVLFLGDYVDRGPHDVEVVLFLLAWYILCPENVILLRGNHEDEEVNGDIQLYGETSFRKKCWKFFNKDNGEIFWNRVNDVFAELPIVAIIDSTIFACHGGIPLLREKSSSETGEVKNGKKGFGVRQQQRKQEENKKEEQDTDHVELMNDVPCMEFFQLLINGMPNELEEFRFRCMMPDVHDNDLKAQHRRLIRELLWNDPVPQFSTSTYGNNGNGTADTEFTQQDGFDVNGFRTNFGRGDHRNVIREFSASALVSFMERWGFTLLIRAHQQKMAGIEMGLAGRILTLFSCCNYTGDTNRAGACIVVDGEVRLVSWRTVLGTSRDEPPPETLRSSFDDSEETQIPHYVGLRRLRFG